MGVFPVGSIFGKAFYGCTDPFGIYVTILVFPTFLKDHVYFGGISTRHVNNFAETGCFDSVICSRGLHFVVKYNCVRSFRERNSGVQFTLWVFRVLDRFMHLPQVNCTRYEYGDVHDAQHFTFFHECFDTYTIAVVSFLRENGDTTFRDSTNFGHNVGCSPRGNRGTNVWFVSYNCV